ncbi:hypothetical protein [Clostridium sp.]|uniref:hypothetical protein n=1 Tax=Clostridium sp. TaxID=1506 RepID=UPI003F3B5A97
MTKDKKYIENLFRNFKKNKARLKMLELGLVSDEDHVIGAIDYSKDKIQTSNLSSLDNIVERREKEKEQLEKDIAITEILLESLKEDDGILVEAYYIEGKTQTQVANIINVYEVSTVWRRREKLLDCLMELI